MTKVTPEDIKRVKALGFLLNRGTSCFSMRVITENGTLSAAQLKNLSETAEKFGNGTVAFTTRLTAELPGIPYEKIEDAREYISREGMVSGGTGAKIRPVVSCKGTTCIFGKIDTQALAAQIHKKHFEGWGNVSLPHKFKIAVGGCPNNCVKPDLNDFGIAGQLRPNYSAELCRGCKQCMVQKACPMGAPKRGGDGKIAIDKDICTQCGRCVEKCVFGAIPDGTRGMKVYIGGRWGKKTRHGTALDELFTTNEQIFETLEKVILFFRSEGIRGERLGETIDRLGVDCTKKALSGNALLERKDEILTMEMK